MKVLLPKGSITKRKDGLWQAAITIGRDPATGKLKRATFYAKTRQEAADKLTKALRDTVQGIFVAPHKLTLGEWLNTWLWEYKRPKLRSNTLDSYIEKVRTHLQPGLGHIPLKDLRPDQVQHFYNERRQHGLSTRTIRYCHTLLHGALAQAEKNQLVARNIATLVEPPRKERKEMQTLTLDQVTTTLLPTLEQDRLGAAIFLAFGTGLRRGELLGLRWRDVDLQTGKLHVRQTLYRIRNHDDSERKTQLVFQEPKTEKSRRTVPIPALCLPALKRHKTRQAEEKLLIGAGYQDHGLVFCGIDGQPCDPAAFTRHFTRLLKRVGLPLIRLHDTRHTYATWLLEQGVALKVTQTLLGHSSIAVTADVYSHVNPEIQRDAAERLNAALLGKL